MLWVEALHVIAVIAWMAALLYLPRLFVYHADSAAGSDKSETFKVMERRLFYGIATPAMAGAWIFGLWLVWLVRAWEENWFLAKLACVLALTFYQGLLRIWMRGFAEDRNRRPARFFRLMNEVPTILLIAIVILVIVKPF
jgi:protoporphyrinogen IX oxidase